jgi:glutathione S-transferase
MTTPLRLHQLVIDNGLAISPFVWRIRYALAHKGLEVEEVPAGFTDIPKAAGGGFKTVPILEHGDTRISESFDIADYLDRAFPDAPLFATRGERAAAQLFDSFYLWSAMRMAHGFYALDIHNAARAVDRPYYRQSREARFGGPLEEMAAGRDAGLPAFREALQPLRMTLARQPWLAGDAPGYADYIGLGGFLWLAGVASAPPLAAGDPLLGWIDRGRDLYGGLGRDPRQRPLAAPN